MIECIVKMAGNSEHRNIKIGLAHNCLAQRQMERDAQTQPPRWHEGAQTINSEGEPGLNEAE